jgi:hypothetical protein
MNTSSNFRVPICTSATPRFAANQTFTSGFPQGKSSLPPVAITAIPDGKLHAPYFMEWSLGMEHQFGTTASLKAQYVGTRAVNQPYSTQANGYQTVCQGCFAPGVAPESDLWETVGMAKKRTKADRAQRQADQLEKSTDTRPEQTPTKPKTRGDFSQAAARIVREATENK